MAATIRLDLPEGPRRAAEAARKGLVLLFPTDTVYGLGSGAPEAAERLYALKGRDPKKPLPVLAASARDAARLARMTPLAEALARRFWPGPLTLVLDPAPEGRPFLTGGAQTLAVRVPDLPALREAISLSGGAWLSTSANASGEPPLADGEEAVRRFQDRVDLILLGGEPAGAESTVADARGPEPLVLRAGTLSEAALREAARQEA